MRDFPKTCLQDFCKNFFAAKTKKNIFLANVVTRKTKQENSCTTFVQHFCFTCNHVTTSDSGNDRPTAHNHLMTKNQHFVSVWEFGL